MNTVTLFKIIRQDDNGNRFVVATKLSEQSADARLASFIGHKQTYWKEPQTYEKSYCGPCAGYGQVHQMMFVGDMATTQPVQCGSCYGDGYTLREISDAAHAVR